MKNVTQKILLTAVVAGFMTGASVNKARAEGDQGASDSSGTYECKGGNSCKGQGACGGPGHSCAGKNACMGKGYIQTKDKAECDGRMAQVKREMKMKKGMKKRG
ncbi:MAG: hypothetical protein AB7F43_07145 [Bacteriovoracia bacterium]